MYASFFFFSSFIAREMVYVIRSYAHLLLDMQYDIQRIGAMQPAKVKILPSAHKSKVKCREFISLVFISID